MNELIYWFAIQQTSCCVLLPLSCPGWYLQ